MGLIGQKPVFGGFEKSEAQTSLLSYTDKLEFGNFAGGKLEYGIFRKANNKDADQTARMHRLVCAFVVRKPPMTGFFASRPKLLYGVKSKQMKLLLV